MQWTPVLAVMFLAATVAGCFGGSEDEGDPISYTIPADPRNEPVLFEAGVSGEVYEWAFGDGTTGEGRTVEHLYGTTIGAFTVKLLVDDEEFVTALLLGEGENLAPEFVLEANTPWLVTGETATFSAAASVDPEDDLLRYAWTCFRTSALIIEPPHEHPGQEGVPYGTTSVEGFESRFAEAPLPAADRTVEGDFCENVGAGTLGLDATIEGTFQTPGVYAITLIAKDATHPSRPGSITVYVSEPDERPDAVVTADHSATLIAGSNGNLQVVGDTLAPGTVIDRAEHNYIQVLPGATWINLTHTSQFPVDPSEVSFTLYKGSSIVAAGVTDGTLQALGQGSYTIQVNLDQGLMQDYEVTIVSHLIMDPCLKYACH